MQEEYDVVVLGTGLTECILSGLLSVDGKKVLHMDRNNYYGGACASLNLEDMWKHFNQEGNPPAALGRARDWNIDLVPKFIMSQGKMVQILLHCDVARYLEFKSVDGSYVFVDKKVHKVPATEKEAITSGLMGFLEKYRFKDFLMYAVGYDPKEPKSHQGKDLNALTARQVLTTYKLDKSTMDFVGHAMALYRDDEYLDKPAMEFVLRVKLYAESLNTVVHHYKGKSSYLYPMYGLGDLPQAFARLASIYGGTYMLNKPFFGIENDASGRVVGVMSDEEVLDEKGKQVGTQPATVKCKAVIADPTYFMDKVKKIGRMVRAICILDHPIPNTDKAESCQIIIPQAQANRRSDIYISCVSFAHNVAAAGKYIGIVSTTVETEKPEDELKPGLALLGTIIKSFVSITDLYEPSNNSAQDGVFISKSYDATSHFETVIEDVMRIYKELTGKDVDLTPKIRTEEH